MPHHTPLIATIVFGLVFAFVLGAIANRLRISPLVGYLAAGILAGPFTPGFVADQALAPELAEIGVILLMFGVGLHFSLKDLLSVKAIAIPGAMVQIACATMLGLGLALLMGWSVSAGVVFGLALSVASTVVLLRALQDRRILDTEKGKIAVGWLIVEDLAMVLTLVLLPALAGVLSGGGAIGSAILITLAITLGKVVAFVALMLVIGRQAIPWVLHHTAHTGSRELFRLGVLAIALGVAYGAAALFGVSFALGAFFAGMILSESQLSHRAAQDILPLRDAFAVLFFVSVGMLFDPKIVLSQPLPLLATVFIITVGKSVAAFAIVKAFGRSTETSLIISASLAQIGEFSFILATLGVGLKVLPETGRDLILAGAILSILANPLVFAALDRWQQRGKAAADTAVGDESEVPEPVEPLAVENHVVLVGYGRVGAIVGEHLIRRGEALLVIEQNDDLRAGLAGRGVHVLSGRGEPAQVVRIANIAHARRLFVAIPETFEAGQLVEKARALNAHLPIVARAHSEAEIDYLMGLGATKVIMGEREIAMAMIDQLGLGDEGPAAPTGTVPLTA